MLVVILLCIDLLLFAHAKSPTFLTCKVKDLDCLKSASDQVIKLLKSGNNEANEFHVLDPLLVKKIAIAGNGGSVDLEQTYQNLVMNGLSESVVDNISVNLENGNCGINITTRTPVIILSGIYQITGKLLVFTLKGNGNVSIKLDDVTLTTIMPCEKYKKDNVEFLKVDNTSLTIDTKKTTFDLENLIDGNPELSQEVLKVVNENDRDIFLEIRYGFEATYAKVFQVVANSIFSKIPLSDLFQT